MYKTNRYRRGRKRNEPLGGILLNRSKSIPKIPCVFVVLTTIASLRFLASVQIEPYLTGLRPKQLDEYHEAFRHSGVQTSARATSATRTTPRRGSGRISFASSRVHVVNHHVARPFLGSAHRRRLWPAEALLGTVAIP